MDAKDKVAFINSVGNTDVEANTNNAQSIETVFCIECGTSNSIDARFCENCGTAIAQVVNDEVDVVGRGDDNLLESEAQLTKVYDSYQDIHVTPKKKRYISEISTVNIDKIIQSMEDGQLVAIKLAEQLDKSKAIATGLPEWSLEPPEELVRRIK